MDAQEAPKPPFEVNMPIITAEGQVKLDSKFGKVSVDFEKGSTDGNDMSVIVHGKDGDRNITIDNEETEYKGVRLLPLGPEKVVLMYSIFNARSQFVVIDLKSGLREGFIRDNYQIVDAKSVEEMVMIEKRRFPHVQNREEPGLDEHKIETVIEQNGRIVTAELPVSVRPGGCYFYKGTEGYMAVTDDKTYIYDDMTNSWNVWIDLK